jgi:metal-sulfur cluster biosynthetic enzyme
MERPARMTNERDALRAEIAARLDRIPEPCSIAMGGKLSLGGMGLVEDIAIDHMGAVTVTLCLTDPACVHFGAMQRFIADELEPMDGVTSVLVVQTLEMLWTPDRASAK